jgi:hypothetical protein
MMVLKIGLYSNLYLNFGLCDVLRSCAITQTALRVATKNIGVVLVNLKPNVFFDTQL